MLQNRQTNTMSPPLLRRVRSGWWRWWWAFKKTEFCTDKGVPREPYVHPETELAGQTCSLTMFACVIISMSKSGFRCSHGSLLHIVCPCLSLAVGPVDNSGKSTGGEGAAGSGIPGLHCLHTPTQHEVSGSATPSATWDTGGHSHTRSGMWCSGLECMIHGMLRRRSTRWWWNVMSHGLYLSSHGWLFHCFLVVFCWDVCSCTVMTFKIGQLQQDMSWSNKHIGKCAYSLSCRV